MFKPNLKGYKDKVIQWRTSGNERLIRKANKLAKFIKGYEKSLITYHRLSDLFIELNNMR